MTAVSQRMVGIGLSHKALFQQGLKEMRDEPSDYLWEDYSSQWNSDC